MTINPDYVTPRIQRPPLTNQEIYGAWYVDHHGVEAVGFGDVSIVTRCPVRGCMLDHRKDRAT